MLIDLCIKIVPFYVLIILGFIGGKTLEIDKTSIGLILFYIVVPIVLFDVGLNTDIKPEYFLLPLIMFAIGALLCILSFKFAKNIFNDGRANLIAFSAGTGNTGYFGLPLALLIFGEEWAGIYMLGNLGLSIYDYTIGAYVISRDTMTKKKALQKVSRLPMIYAYFLGLILHSYGFTLSCEFQNVMTYMRGTYITLGMMLIGFGLSTVKKLKPDFKFLSIFLAIKYILYPAFALLFVFLDESVFHLFNDKVHDIFILLSIVPPATNTVVFATVNKCYPEEASTAVFIGTVIALLYVPLMIHLFI